MTGKELRERREKYGLTQQDLASQLGISYTTISRWEREETRPNRLYSRIVREFFEMIEKEKRKKDEKATDANKMGRR